MAKCEQIVRLAGLIMGLVWSLTALAVPGEIPYVGVAGAAPVPQDAGAGLRSAEELEIFLDGVMADQLSSHEVVGATIAVVKDGELFFVKGYGYSDLESGTPMNGETALVRPGSVSKLLTWTALMQLVEQGKVELDADVNNYLKTLQLPDTFSAPITIRNLLTHTEGLEDGGLGYLIVGSADELRPMREFLALHQPERVRPPTTDFSSGENASYSNWGTALAGVIIEDVTGQTFDDYIQTHILTPLGMTQSTFAEPLPAALAANMAQGYVREGGRIKPKDFEFIHNFGPAGSLTASAPDMARFMLAHLQDGEYQGARILKPQTAQLMHSRQFSPSPHVNGSGLGFYETRINGRRLLSHAGDTMAFHSDLHLLKEQGIGLFVSYNSGASLPISSRGHVLRAFMDRYFPASLPSLEVPADFADRAAEYAGSYRMTRRSYTKNEALFSAFSAIKVAATDDNRLLLGPLLTPTPSEWVEIAPDTFRRVDRDDTVSFLRNAEGEVSHMTLPLPFISLYKLDWHQTREFHGLLMVLALIAALGAVVGTWRHRREASTGATRARWLAGLNGLAVLGIMGGMGASIAVLIKDPIAGFPGFFHGVLVLILLSLLLSMLLAGCAVAAWRQDWFDRATRIRYSLSAVIFLAMMWSLAQWNLIGFHFG